MNFSVIPEPQSLQIGEREVFRLTSLCEIEYDEGSEKAYNCLKKYLSDVFSMELKGTGREKIILRRDPAVEKDEGYTLRVSEDTVTVCGKDEAGVLYGVQSLRQLLFQGELALPEIYIEDYPRFSYRGLMLDCGRYFFTKQAVFVFLEMMALHKLNVFHWHLSEDQGFRAQILDKLLLTEIGSFRSHTNFNSRKHEGYYTVEDMKEVVEYAHSLCIKVIPEIDTPGHVVSMIAAYPELSCFDRELSVATHWGIKNDVLCVGKDSTIDFMKCVFDELLETFTDGVFHLGGDEVPTVRWKLCPHCQKRMKQQGLRTEGELHTWYLDTMAAYLREKGIATVMYNDKVKDYMVNRDIAWQLWDTQMSREDVVSEINKGRKFIVSANEAYYLDFPYGITNLKKAYDFEPVYEGVCAEKENNVLGVEACLWTEFVPTMKKAGYQTYPRLGAISETAWTSKEKKNYDRFSRKLPEYYSLLWGYGIDYAKKPRAMPGLVSRLAGRIYWERRQLCWHGIHNFFDDLSVKIKYSRRKEEEND